MTQFLTAVAAGVIAGLLLAAGHWAIDRARRGRPIHLILAYVYGVATLNDIYSGWALLLQPDHSASVIGLWTIAAIAGAFDLSCYALDHWSDSQKGRNELEERREADR